MNEMLDLARKHVVEGRKIVARQRQIVESLRMGGRERMTAEATLDVFERALAIFEDHVRALETEAAHIARKRPP
jgi:hypothetical protein